MHETETRRKTRNLLSSLVGTNIYCQCVLTRNSSVGAKHALAIRVDFTFRSYGAIDLMRISNYKYFAPTERGLGPLNLYGSKVDFGLAFASGVVDPEGFGEA